MQDFDFESFYIIARVNYKTGQKEYLTKGFAFGGHYYWTCLCKDAIRYTSEASAKVPWTEKFKDGWKVYILKLRTSVEEQIALE